MADEDDWSDEGLFPSQPIIAAGKLHAQVWGALPPLHWCAEELLARTLGHSAGSGGSRVGSGCVPLPASPTQPPKSDTAATPLHALQQLAVAWRCSTCYWQQVLI